MRIRRVFWALLVVVVSLGFLAPNAQAVPVTYDLASGQVTYLGSSDGQNDFLTNDILLSAASVTIDFAPPGADTTPNMTNLFAQGPDFSLAQTSTSSDLLAVPGMYVLLDTPVTITSSLLGGSVPAQLGGSNIVLSDGGLKITMTGVALGREVKVDFDLVARSLDGATAIPEPGSELLFPAGLALLGWLLRLPRSEARC